MAKLLFLQNIEYEFLGPMYISSMIKDRHICKLKLGSKLEDFLPIIDSFKPDIIGFSIMTGSHIWALNIARQIKRHYNVITLFGGAHPTFFPEFINNDGVDIICRGEGEEAVIELLDALDVDRDIKDIKNLVVKEDGHIYFNDVRPLRDDLDYYPFPDRELYPKSTRISNTGIYNVITSRGCPFNCSFCFEKSMRELYKDKGSYVRIRKIENVIKELKQLKLIYGAKIIYFCDDIFGLDKKWLYSFLEIYKREIDIEFFCLVRADIVCSDESYAKRLRDAGCRTVFFGIETGNENIRNNILKKNIKNTHIIRAAELLHRAGIKFRTYNMLGLPDETLEDAFKTIEMNINIKTDYPWCSIFIPYPKTELSEYAKEKGYLLDNFSPDFLSQSFFINSPLLLPNIKRMENLQKFFTTAVLFPKTFKIIKFLILFPPNIFFRFWFGIVYTYLYIKSESRDIKTTIFFALRNFRYLILRGSK